MHPVLFRVGPFTAYSYGFMIAVGVVAGAVYLYWRGRREAGLTFDQVNTLMILLFAAAFAGGKLFLFFENPSYYLEQPGRLLSGSGFVFYGSFLLCVPVMWWFFRRHQLPLFHMLDIMGGVTALLHMFGRWGCFFAGCCFGKPLSSGWGVVFTDPSCQTRPLHTPLFPSQPAEALSLLLIFIWLQVLHRHRRFYGQVFLQYLMLYAVVRFVLEFFRGDDRGFVLNGLLSHAQLIAILLAFGALYLYTEWKERNAVRA